MTRHNDLFEKVCPVQQEGFRRFIEGVETGDNFANHVNNCVACQNALDTVLERDGSELREVLKPQAIE